VASGNLDLTVTECRCGCVVLVCACGCAPVDIVKALGLTLDDLLCERHRAEASLA
jgi:hypothetical protein